MWWRFACMRWRDAWCPCACVIAVLGLGACVTSAKPAAKPQLPDRRELPAVPVVPVNTAPRPAPGAETAPPSLPRAVRFGALTEGERIADLAVLAEGDRFLLAGAAGQGDAGLAWVGKDAGIGQVFVTRLSRAGEKQAQRMVTRSKEGCSDVSLVRHKDGFIIAYVDSRDHTPGIYAVKVGKDLQRVGGERLVALVKGEASDVRMIARGDELVVAWVEARQNAELYGVFAARLLAADLTVRGDPARVILAPQHARGLELAALGEGVALGWIEDRSDAQAGASAQKTALLAGLDPALRLAGEPLRLALPAEPSSIALECDRACHVVIAGSEGDELAFYGLFFEGRSPSPAARLTSLAGVSTEDTTPVVARDWLFFAEDNLRGAGRIRKAKLTWR